MAGYTFHGLYKYQQLWWRSYRLMMRKERFKKLFLMVMTVILLFLWTAAFKKLMENVSMISAAAMTLAVVKTDGTLLVCDRMQSGCEDRPDFVKIADGIRTAESGDGVLLAISRAGTLLYWKKQEQNSCCGPPEKLMEHVKQVSAGVGHYAALTDDGSLWMWGKNDCAQLGDGTHTDRHKPKKIMEHVIQVSLGARHSAAVDTRHRLWMWGDNTLGQLGTHLPGSRKRPVMVMRNVRELMLVLYMGHILSLNNHGGYTDE